MDAEQLIFARRHAVCIDAPAQDGLVGVVPARQLDAVLTTIGFKLSAGLIEALACREPGYVIDTAVKVIGWARELTGSHRTHNAYFIDFPRNVPDTVEFWASCLRDALQVNAGIRGVMTHSTDAGTQFFLDLLSLPTYGRYQHTYSELIEHHAELIPALSDRITVIHAGRPISIEMGELFTELAGSRVPLSGENLDALRVLADTALINVRDIPVRENRAIINAIWLRHHATPVCTTYTDFVRLAAELTGGDVTLTKPAKFRFRRPERRAFMLALNAFAQEHSGTHLGEILPYAEQWKRIAERIKPHEYTGLDYAQLVFAVARGEYPDARTLMSHVESAFALGNVIGAASWLAQSPGLLWRNADRLWRSARTPDELFALPAFFRDTAPQVSGRVLLSVREHLMNRGYATDVSRIFVNRKGHAWVAAETRKPLDPAVFASMSSIIDAQIMDRLPDPGHLVVDPDIYGAALPLSGKGTPEGLGVFPRGSVMPVGPYDTLRFFTYWRQTHVSTDYDLSALFTDEQFGNDSHISYTQLSNFGGVHSGDIVDAPAPHGATEFIDIQLPRIGRGFVIPQVYIFRGEGFDEVDENFFGFMTRNEAQRGLPFEARTVRSKSALFGDGKVALPVIFFRGEDGRWYAKWLHLYSAGRPGVFGGHRVEENKVTAKLLARSVMGREYLRVEYLARMLALKASAMSVDADTAVLDPDYPVTYLGIGRPEKLPEGSTVITLENLSSIIPQ